MSGLEQEIRAAYLEDRIDVDEFERDIATALAGGTPGTRRSRYSSEEPAGPVYWFEPKYASLPSSGSGRGTDG